MYFAVLNPLYCFSQYLAICADYLSIAKKTLSGKGDKPAAVLVMIWTYPAHIRIGTGSAACKSLIAGVQSHPESRVSSVEEKNKTWRHRRG